MHIYVFEEESARGRRKIVTCSIRRVAVDFTRSKSFEACAASSTTAPAAVCLITNKGQVRLTSHVCEIGTEEVFLIHLD